MSVFRLIVALAALTPVGALAQAPSQSGPPSPWRFRVEAGAVHQFESDLDSAGSVSINRAFGRATLGYGFGPRTSIGLSLGAGVWDYDFSGGANLGGGEPWSTVRDYRISVPMRFGVSDTITAFVIPSLRFDAESGASMDDGRTEGVLAGAAWRFTPSLSIGPGVGVFTTLEDDVTVFPILLLDWDVTERLNIGTGGGLGATQGPGLNATYRVTDALTIGLGARYEDLEFRLDDSGPAPDGIGSESGVPVYATATYTPNPRVSVSVIGGVEFGGELTLSDSAGREIDSRDVDPAPFLGLSGSLRF
jgi:hypothetical protein